MSDNSAVMGAKSPLPGEVLAPEKTKGRMGVFYVSSVNKRCPLWPHFLLYCYS